MAQGSAIRAGRAFVELATKSKLGKGLARARAQLKAFAGFARAQGARIAGFGMGIGAMIATPLIAASKHFADVGDKLHKMSARTGVSASALSELGHAAELSGASIDQLGSGLFRMRRRVANAASATGPAVRALKELGINAKDLNKMKPEDQFTLLADKLSKMDDQSRAAQLGFEIFGDGAKALLPLIQSGAVGIEEMRQRARELGVTMTDEGANSAAALTDAMFELWASIKGGVLAIGAAAAPFLTLLAEKIAQVVGWVVNWIQNNGELMASIMRIVGIVLAVLAGVVAFGAALAMVGVVISGMMAAVGALGAALAFLLNPITLIVGGLAAAGAAFLHFSGTGGAAIDWLAGKFQSLLDVVRPVLQGIFDALAAGNLALAGEIAWLGLEAAFYAGMARVLPVWHSFTDGLWSAWDQTLNRIRVLWNDIVSSIAKGLLTVAGMFGLVDAEATIRIISDDQRAFADGLEKQAERNANARQAAGAASLAETNAKLGELQRKLNRATAQAASEAEASAPTPGPAGPELPELAGVTATADSAAGSFSALGAAMLGRGGGGIQSQQLEALLEIAAATRKGADAGEQLNNNLGAA